MYGWYPTSLIMEVDLFVPYKVIACVWERIKQIRKNSWQAWQEHPLIGSHDGKKGGQEYYAHVKDF